MAYKKISVVTQTFSTWLRERISWPSGREKSAPSGSMLDKRKEPRMSVAASVCLAVNVLDISKNGMSFAAKRDRFQIGDWIEVVLDSENFGRAVQRGRILSHRLQVEDSAVIDTSINRFSVQFQNEIDGEILADLRSLRLHPAEAAA